MPLKLNTVFINCSMYANIATVCSQSSCVKLFTPTHDHQTVYTVFITLVKAGRHKISLHLSIN